MPPGDAAVRGGDQCAVSFVRQLEEVGDLPPARALLGNDITNRDRQGCPIRRGREGVVGRDRVDAVELNRLTHSPPEVEDPLVAHRGEVDVALLVLAGDRRQLEPEEPLRISPDRIDLPRDGNRHPMKNHFGPRKHLAAASHEPLQLWAGFDLRHRGQYPGDAQDDRHGQPGRLTPFSRREPPEVFRVEFSQVRREVVRGGKWTPLR